MSAASVDRHEMVRRAAREEDPDRYIAALLAPRACRDDLIALAAFAGAVLKIPYQVTEAQIGEIRVAWWREAINSSDSQASTGNPVADAFCEVFRRHNLDHQAVEALFNQVVDRIYAAPIATFESLARDIDATQGTLFRFARQILGGGSASGAQSEAFTAAAEAFGLAQAARMLPYDLARERLPFPGGPVRGDGDWKPAIGDLRARASVCLEDFRSAQSAMLDADLWALLPVALVEPYFEALSGAKHNPARDLAEISPLARVWRLAMANAFGRF